VTPAGDEAPLRAVSGDGLPPQGEDGETFTAAAAAGDSMSVAAWTMVSRVTGVLRVVAIGAVLGPTLLGNTFQFTNSLPNLVYYGFLAGSLFSSLLVPALVPSMDAGDRRSAERIAGGFLGVTLAALAVAAVTAVLLGPLVLRFGALGTQQEAVGASQERIGRWLLILLMPQVLFYAVVGTSTAVMNARRRFALAAAAPAVENLGILVVLAVSAGVYGTETTLDDVPPGQLLLLGLGATAAVCAHASLQWWGAHHVGVTLLPRAGWRQPDVMALIRRTIPALGLAGLTAMQLLTMLVLGNRVPGGVVALQVGLTFYFFLIALGVTPVALSLLPRLARLHRRGEQPLFRETLVRGVALALFLTVPGALGYLAISTQLAEVMSIGRMDSPAGTALVAASMAALAPGILGETVFVIATYAAYAREQTRAPLRSMLVQAVCFMALAGLTLFVSGPAVPTTLGLAWSVASIVGAWHLAASLRGSLVGFGSPLGPSVRRIALGAVVMVVPVRAVIEVVPRWLEGRLGSSVAVVAAVTVGAAVYLLLQALWHAPELVWVSDGAAQLRGRVRLGRGGTA
jgi:putative peptidoglycan lipid II flippase